MEWREKIVACRSSGQAVRRWCREQGITEKTYYRWEREVLGETGKRLAVRSGSESPAFVEVRAGTQDKAEVQAGGTVAAKLHTEAGDMDIYNGADGDTLRAIIGALKEC